MKKRWTFVLLPLLAFVLELLPNGAVLYFANPDGPAFRETYSYFSLTPFGYANVTPVFVAVLTCVILALTLINIVKPGKRILNVMIGLSAAAAVLSLCPLLFGISYLTPIGWLICLVLILHAIRLIVFQKRSLPDSAAG